MNATIEIPFPILSRNAVDKLHWSKRARLRKQYEQAVALTMCAAGAKQANRGRYVLTLTTYRIRPIKDQDNLVGGAKQMIDALTRAGYIPDDAAAVIGTPEIRQERCRRKEEERTVIERRAV